MPTLIRFLTFIAIIAALVYAAMFAVVSTVEPRKTKISVPVPISIRDQGRGPSAPEDAGSAAIATPEAPQASDVPEMGTDKP